MLSAGIIIPERTDNNFIHSLPEINGVEWNVFYPSGKENRSDPENSLIFSSADILPLICELLIVLDPAYCRFEYLSTAVRNGCHLFLSDKLELNFEERKELIRLAKEGGTFIQIRNDFLFEPTHDKIVVGKNTTCYIEIDHSEPLLGQQIKERLLYNLFLVQMAAGVPVYRFDVFYGPVPVHPPDILNLHLRFINGTTASVNLTFRPDQHPHTMKIYHRKGLSKIDLYRDRNMNYLKKGEITAAMIGQIEGFIMSIRDKTKPLFTLNDELEIYLLWNKIKEKLASQMVMY